MLRKTKASNKTNKRDWAAMLKDHADDNTPLTLVKEVSKKSHL